MNKKILLFGIPILAFALVSAVAYYAMFSVSFSVNQPVEVGGDLTQEIPGIVESGETFRGTAVTLENDGTSEREVVLSDDSDTQTFYDSVGNVIDGINVRYVVETELSTKDTSTWALDGDKVTVEYTLVGDSFTAEVVEGALTGYELVYYADDENSQTVAERTAHPQPVIRLSEISENLPYMTDGNWQEDTDYSGEPDFYDTLKGAKLWYVPTDAIDENDNTLDWGQWDSFYYETELIQFNSEGNLIVYPNVVWEIYPEYTLDEHLVGGSYSVTTTIA